MTKRKTNLSGFSSKKAAEAAERQKKAQQKALIRMAGVLVVAVLIIIGIYIAIPLLQGEAPAETSSTAADTSGSAAAGTSPSGTLLASERPLAELDPAERTDYYPAAPEMIIDTDNVYQAVITLENGGQMVFELFDDQAPVTVNNFVFLANQGFYDGIVFHRVIEDFMAQGGDPTGTGIGGPGYQFEDEFDPALRFDRRGLLAMANAGPGTNGSQFFITFVPTPHLNDLHTIFGELISGDDVLEAITIRDPSSDIEPDVIEKIEIYER